MPWTIKGTYYAPCSCNVGCPCTLGELDADRGWCSGVLAFDIEGGNVDGLNVAGAKAVFVGDWPRGFLSGDGTGRLWFDTGVSDQQRTALEGVLGGQRGGVFEVVGSLMSKTLPSKTAPISIQKGPEETRLTVGDVGNLTVKILRGPTGEPTRLLHGAAAFRDDITLAKGTGSSWRDPEMRQWESGGHAEQTDFDWSA